MQSRKRLPVIGLSLFCILTLLLSLAAAPAEATPSIDMDSVYVADLGGANVEITVSVTDLRPAGGFDLVFSYDPSGLRLVFAEPIGVVADWEYFTYRYTQQDTCPDGCPFDLVRLVGLADLACLICMISTGQSSWQCCGGN